MKFLRWIFIIIGIDLLLLLIQNFLKEEENFEEYKEYKDYDSDIELRKML
ncbi:hypothetical protein [Staphylococcus sp. GDY8P168P-1]|nr:hypothetical protein [Staphylococcus sp. GDY8P168P-1]